MIKKIPLLLLLFIISSFTQHLAAMQISDSVGEDLRKSNIISRAPSVSDTQDPKIMQDPTSIEEKDLRKPHFISQLSEVADDYDAFVIDLHGTVHDGQNLYPGVMTCLQNLHALGKKIVFLSNSARPHNVVRESLLRRGIPSHLYDTVITSGDKAFEDLHALQEPFASLGHRYFYIGKDNDQHLFDPRLQEALKISDADFILALNIPPLILEEYIPLLQIGIDKKIPLICANPDLCIYTYDGTRQICAGTLAQWYENQGGQVHHYGKPHSPIYHRVTNFFRNEHPSVSRILVIGDTLRTDILGGNTMNWDSVFIAGGTHQRDLEWEGGETPTEGSLQTLFRRESIFPTYVLPYLR